KKIQDVPVVFVAGDRRWRLTPRQVGVTADWHSAVEVARRHSGGFGPLRGFRRIGVRVFGAEFAPPTQVYDAALQSVLHPSSRALSRPHRDAQVRLHGLEPVVVPGTVGRTLDRAAAARIVVAALAGFGRRTVALPVRSERPTISAAQVALAASQARV